MLAADVAAAHLPTPGLLHVPVAELPSWYVPDGQFAIWVAATAAEQFVPSADAHLPAPGLLHVPVAELPSWYVPDGQFAIWVAATAVEQLVPSADAHLPAEGSRQPSATAPVSAL